MPSSLLPFPPELYSLLDRLITTRGITQLHFLFNIYPILTLQLEKMWKPSNTNNNNDNNFRLSTSSTSSSSSGSNAGVDHPEPAMDSEHILKRIQKLYLEKEVGLGSSARFLSDPSIKITIPEQKVTVLVVGHHPIAKQRFLDLYFDDARQNSSVTRVNYQEQLDKIVIMHGNRRKWLSGKTVLDYCPHLARLRNVSGLEEYLTTEIASKQTKSLVSFILAPDTVSEHRLLLQGENPEFKDSKQMDMEKAIGTLAEASDLIFIFFDPTASVPARTTLKPFKDLWFHNHEKVHLLLAKVGPEDDQERTRESVLGDIVRECWRTSEINRVGYLPLIYTPDLSSKTKDDQRLWKIIQQAKKDSVFRALKQLEKDALKIRSALISKQEQNDRAQQGSQGGSSWFLWIAVVVAILLAMLVSEFNDRMCQSYETGSGNWKSVCSEFITNKMFITALGGVAFYACFRSFPCFKPVRAPLSKEQEELLHRRILFTNRVLAQRRDMERLYLSSNSELNR